jgi:hypothetical protein
MSCGLRVLLFVVTSGLLLRVASYFELRVRYLLLRVVRYSMFNIQYCSLSIANCLLLKLAIAHCELLLPIVNCLLSIANSPIPSFSSKPPAIHQNRHAGGISFAINDCFPLTSLSFCFLAIKAVLA